MGMGVSPIPMYILYKMLQRFSRRHILLNRVPTKIFGKKTDYRRSIAPSSYRLFSL